jgi:hypothetical protein
MASAATLVPYGDLVIHFTSPQLLITGLGLVGFVIMVVVGIAWHRRNYWRKRRMRGDQEAKLREFNRYRRRRS